MLEDWRQKAINQFLSQFAVGFGLGLSPIMPGTCGSLLALVIAPLLIYSQHACIGYVFLLVLAYISADYEGKKRQDHDHKSIVCDEVIGLLPVLLYFPYADWLLAFVLFRFFDIVKPWPISWIDRTDSPAACLADDVVAGMFALLVMKAVYAFW